MAGRPTKLTPEVQKNLADVFASGSTGAARDCGSGTGFPPVSFHHSKTRLLKSASFSRYSGLSAKSVSS